jgi:integrase/recombinase XerD
MGRPMTKARKVRVEGPLAPFVAELKSGLRGLGYTLLTTASELRVMAHLSHWLEAGGMTVADLTSERIGQYLNARRSAGYSSSCSRRSLAPLLDVLGRLDVLPEEVPGAPVSATSPVLISFERYLLHQRGLADSTAAAYVDRARRFVAGFAADGKLTGLTAKDVTTAVLRESNSVSVGSAQYFVAALRSFLRFCFVEGLTTSDLSAAALAVTGRRSSPLPKGISRDDAEALLGACDRRESTGRRDYAILITLLHLGLRASEVAGLTLDDIHWRMAEIEVHGKGRRDDRLPLPDNVGEALAGYLRRGRPKTARREVFLRGIAPVVALGRGGVSSIVRRACARAGVAIVGAHRLRHTLACEMVRAGVPLPEIGQVLRHRSMSSTAIYARVDVDQLRQLAQPWPGGAHQ